ncbi:hypothetical protein NC653_036264 [Populus alba x Populus x berolinensis]|uniref:Uncharacterized protein n=1 Tax=Populus alba x Populus x berolinensis TaxID=444605 RepID=A0AAD6LJH5_9ROSI|nr:hypothetical protein NC653_036264 [Populus alba x Populus x berolinensis]
MKPRFHHPLLCNRDVAANKKETSVTASPACLNSAIATLALMFFSELTREASDIAGYIAL